MVFPIRTIRRIARLALLPAAILTFAAEQQVSAQTAPTLLPYTINLVAGSGTSAIASGATCPKSGFKSTDAFGDGCLATEVQLSAPRFVVTDKNGVVFFSDTGNNLIRRIDPTTGVVTAVAGGASTNPALNTSCGSGSTATSTNYRGDGCLSTQVKLNKPEGLAFSPAGDLYVAENGADDVRKIAATGGVVTGPGTITSVVYTSANTFGYNVNNTSTSAPVIAAANGYLNFPYGIAFDTAGNLYIADEGNNALEVINLGTTTQTIQGVSIPAGSIQKFAGYGSLAAKTARSGDCPDFVSTSSRGGCYFGSFTDGSVANTSNVDGVYDVVVDPSGNVYFANEFNDNIGLITSANLISNFAGQQGGKGTTLKRGAAGSFSIGSNFNVGRDASGNIYTSDAINGVVWRIDAGTGEMYVVAGGAASVCANATNATTGDGCPATQAKLSIGTLNAAGFATAPGVAGVSPSVYSDLYITDATANTVRVVSTGTWFGTVSSTVITQQVVTHFAAGDSPASSGAYTLTAGASNFSLGASTCTTNSDNTQDCFLNVTATPPAVPGAFNATLQVKSKNGGIASFPLGGIYVVSPVTRVGITVASAGTSCNGSVLSTNTQQALTATIFSTASPTGAGPTGTVTFSVNGTQVGTPQTVAGNNQATLIYSFANAGTYSITAAYSGDSYFKPSTTTTSVTVIPIFSVSTQESSVVAGGTALYGLQLTPSVYTGSITFACQGLPAYATCVFSPNTLTAPACPTTNTVALSIYTQQATSVNPTSLAGRGRWMPVSLLFGFGLATLLTLRRRRFASRLGAVGLMLAMLLAAIGTTGCGNGKSSLATPEGTYTITVTATGTAGMAASVPVTLIVRAH